MTLVVKLCTQALCTACLCAAPNPKPPSRHSRFQGADAKMPPTQQFEGDRSLLPPDLLLNHAALLQVLPPNKLPPLHGAALAIKTKECDTCSTLTECHAVIGARKLPISTAHMVVVHSNALQPAAPPDPTATLASARVQAIQIWCKTISLGA